MTTWRADSRIYIVEIFRSVHSGYPLRLTQIPTRSVWKTNPRINPFSIRIRRCSGQSEIRPLLPPPIRITAPHKPHRADFFEAKRKNQVRAPPPTSNYSCKTTGNHSTILIMRKTSNAHTWTVPRCILRVSGWCSGASWISYHVSDA